MEFDDIVKKIKENNKEQEQCIKNLAESMPDKSIKDFLQRVKQHKIDFATIYCNLLKLDHLQRESDRLDYIKRMLYSK